MHIHEHIIHHVREHKKKVVAHVQKHHKKYLVGAWILSWMAIYKIIWLIIIFFGMANMGGGTIGADYYDAEFYAQQEANKISISNQENTEDISISGTVPSISGARNHDASAGKNLTWNNTEKEDISH